MNFNFFKLFSVVMAAKNLLDLSPDEQQAFFESFDTIFSDMDGVVWNPSVPGPIDGAADAINKLRKLGKKIYLLTNNSLYPIPLLLNRFKDFSLTKPELVRPITAIVWYLKQIKFDKAVYVVGSRTLQQELIDAGFEVVHNEVGPVPETTEGIVGKLEERRDDVGAVIMDSNFNMDFWGLQMCVEYILKNKALFLMGVSDPVLPYRDTFLIPPVAFVKIVESITNVQPIVLAKPDLEFNKVVQDNLGPFEPKRVLFIGDSVVSDMKFAQNGGYQKLLVLSGITKQSHLDDWQHEQELKPEYVLEGMNDFVGIIDNLISLERLKLSS